MLDERVRQPAQSANPPRISRDQLSVSVLVIWPSSRRIPAEKCARSTCQESGAHSFGRPAAIARAQYQPWREAANPATSRRAHGLAPWQRVCELGARLHLLLESFRENISGCSEALRTHGRISVTRSDCPSAAARAPSRPLPRRL